MTARLKANNSEYYYPKSQYQEGEMVIFGDVLCYTHRTLDFISGTQLNNFKELFRMFYFDWRYEQDRITEDPQLIAFNHTLINKAPDTDYYLQLIILHESKIVVNKVEDQVTVLT